MRTLRLLIAVLSLLSLAGCDDDYQRGRKDGYQLGIEEGTNTGYQKGYAQGMRDGQLSGRKVGEQEGAKVAKAKLDQAQRAAHDEGYRDGFVAANAGNDPMGLASVKSGIAFLALADGVMFTVALLVYVLIRERQSELILAKVCSLVISVLIVVVVFGGLGLGRLVAWLALTSSPGSIVSVAVVAAVSVALAQGCTLLHAHLTSGHIVHRDRPLILGLTALAAFFIELFVLYLDAPSPGRYSLADFAVGALIGAMWCATQKLIAAAPIAENASAEMS